MVAHTEIGRFRVEGHTDDRGNDAFNLDLSQRRASAVVDYLVGVRNVPIRRMVVPYSGGELNPVADNNTRECREQNRPAHDGDFQLLSGFQFRVVRPNRG